jgi:hypothetical protein
LRSIAAAASLVTAVPALAQPYYQGQYINQYQNDQNRPYGGISERLDYLTSRLDQARQNGSINWQEARRLRGVLDQVRSQEQGYLSQGGGHNGWQRNRLNERLNDVAGELHN